VISKSGDIKKAEKLGKKAASKGKRRVPLMDKSLVKLMDTEGVPGESSPLFRAWLKGYDTKKMSENINEAKWDKIMKNVRKGAPSGPWRIIAWKPPQFQAVLDQLQTTTRDAIPAHWEEFKKKYPNSKLSIEDRRGKIVFTEGKADPTIKKKGRAGERAKHLKNSPKGGKRAARLGPRTIEDGKEIRSR